MEKKTEKCATWKLGIAKMNSVWKTVQMLSILLPFQFFAVGQQMSAIAYLTLALLPAFMDVNSAKSEDGSMDFSPENLTRMATHIHFLFSRAILSHFYRFSQNFFTTNITFRPRCRLWTCMWWCANRFVTENSLRARILPNVCWWVLHSASTPRVPIWSPLFGPWQLSFADPLIFHFLERAFYPELTSSR